MNLEAGDNECGHYEDMLSHPRLERIFIKERNRRTTVKERFWADGYKLLQWDRLDNEDVSSHTQKEIVLLVKRYLPSCGKIVISDYRHGLLTEKLAGEIISMGKKMGKPVLVDSQVSQRESNHVWYKGADLICMNTKEAKCVDENFDEKKPELSLERLAKILKVRDVIVKSGDKGSITLSGGEFIKSPAHKVKAIDTTGAGDSFFSVIAASKYPPTENVLRCANVWAGLSTTIIGAEPPRLTMLNKIKFQK